MCIKMGFKPTMLIYFSAGGFIIRPLPKISLEAASTFK